MQVKLTLILLALAFWGCNKPTKKNLSVEMVACLNACSNMEDVDNRDRCRSTCVQRETHRNEIQFQNVLDGCRVPADISTSNNRKASYAQEHCIKLRIPPRIASRCYRCCNKWSGVISCFNTYDRGRN